MVNRRPVGSKEGRGLALWLALGLGAMLWLSSLTTGWGTAYGQTIPVSPLPPPEAPSYQVYLPLVLNGLGVEAGGEGAQGRGTERLFLRNLPEGRALKAVLENSQEQDLVIAVRRVSK